MPDTNTMEKGHKIITNTAKKRIFTVVDIKLTKIIILKEIIRQHYGLSSKQGSHDEWRQCLYREESQQ